MPGLGKKTFTAGDVLIAGDVNNYLMDQTVMKFASAAARSSAIPVPSQGMASYRSDIGIFEVYYELFNAGTNPGGATTAAGWYSPVPLIFNNTPASVNPIPTTATGLGSAITFTPPGPNYKALVELQAQMQLNTTMTVTTSISHSTLPEIANALTTSASASVIFRMGSYAAGYITLPNASQTITPTVVATTAGAAVASNGTLKVTVLPPLRIFGFTI
jgi:hypothetical protein